MGNKKLLVNLVHKALLLVTLCFALWFIINPNQVALGQGFPGFPPADNLPDVDGGLGFGPSVPPAGPGGFITSPNPDDFQIGEVGTLDPGTFGETTLSTPIGYTQEPEPTAQVVINNSSFVASLHGFVISLFGRLLAAAGSLLSVGVSDFVVGFGEIYLNGGVGVVVENMWRTVRDIFNLTFIFGLVYIGLRMILFTDDSQSKRGLGYLIAAALLINFSLFIIKFIIDISNSLAAVIYRGFGGENVGSVFYNLLQMSSITNVGLSSGIVSDVGLGLSYIFGVVIIVGVATFVFAAGGILLIIRFVVLNFYLIFSPVMFLGWVFPGLSKFSSQYWSGFLRNAFMAPAYIFALYFTFLLLGSYRYQLAPGTNLAQIATSTDYVSIGLAAGYYILAIVMMVASIKVASNMGAFGASTVMSVGNNIRGRAQRGLGAAAGGATFGVGARVGRNTVGWGANKFTQSETGKKMASRSLVGKKIYQASNKVADSSFDARRVGGLGKAMGIGEGKKGGYTTRLKESEKSEKEFLDSLGTKDAKDNPAVIEAKAAKDEAQANLKAAEQKLKGETQSERDSIKQLSQEYKTADNQRRQEIGNEINALNASIAAKEKDAQANLEALKEVVKTADATLNTTTASAEYDYQLQYIKTLDKWNQQKQRFSKAATIGAGVAAGAGAMFATGGILIPAVAAGAGAGLVRSSVAHTSSDVKALQKEYGDDGTSKKKSKSEKERIKTLVEEVEKESKSKKPETGGEAE